MSNDDLETEQSIKADAYDMIADVLESRGVRVLSVVEYVCSLIEAQTGGTVLAPIERDESMDRTYIPLPGGWEVQTKGKGSTFRICEPGENPIRLPIPDSPYLHETLERMARDIHAAVTAGESR